MKTFVLSLSLLTSLNTFATDWGGIKCEELNSQNIQIMQRMMKKSMQFQKQLIENVEVKRDPIFDRPVLDLKSEIESEKLDLQRFLAECMIDRPLEKIE